MATKKKKVLIFVILVVAILIILNYFLSRWLLIDIPWLLKEKGPMCGGWFREYKECPEGFYCDYSHSLTDGPGYCLRK